jgi:hypothetical protein
MHGRASTAVLVLMTRRRRSLSQSGIAARLGSLRCDRRKLVRMDQHAVIGARHVAHQQQVSEPPNVAEQGKDGQNADEPVADLRWQPSLSSGSGGAAQRRHERPCEFLSVPQHESRQMQPCCNRSKKRPGVARRSWKSNSPAR